MVSAHAQFPTRTRALLTGALAAVLVATAAGSAAPAGAQSAAEAQSRVCRTDQVAVRPVSIRVQGESATGRVYEPFHCRPGDRKPRRLVVVVHGYGETSADHPERMTALARRTHASLLVMDQRSTTSVWKPGEWNPWAGQQDVVTATQWYQRKHRSIRKTVLWGWSLGGMTSGLALANGPKGLFDYWVDNYGVTDPVYMHTVTGLFAPQTQAQIERDAGGCAPTTCPDAYAARSLTEQAHRLKAKRVVLLHGTADFLVPYIQSVQLRGALDDAGIRSSFYTVVTGRDENGLIVPGGHGIGPVWFEGGCVVERLLDGREPLGNSRNYLVDVATGVNTAPPAPRGAHCAG